MGKKQSPQRKELFLLREYARKVRRLKRNAARLEKLGGKL